VYDVPALSGREREARLIRQANRAAVVGRLMLGELRTWQQFLEADTIDLERLPRRNLKAAVVDVRKRLSPEIKDFCIKNFQGMNESILSLLYEEIKAYRGLELPLAEFEKRFATVRRGVLKGNPIHVTVSISLWGLQFKFPEDELAKDLISALGLIAEAQDKLRSFEARPHVELLAKRAEIASLTQQKMFSVRSAFLCCFNLIEAYLNGLAWDYVQTHGTANLSNQNRKVLEDSTSVSLRDKLRKYPVILTDRELWKNPDKEFDEFVDMLKPYRDSLVHPSPFSAPEKFGGYDKLRLFYRIDSGTTIKTMDLLVRIIRRVHRHVYLDEGTLPEWLLHLESKVEEISKELRL
jgi:hypothetical protein